MYSLDLFSPTFSLTKLLNWFWTALNVSLVCRQTIENIAIDDSAQLYHDPSINIPDDDIL
jgi:hypothetical protein